MRMKVLSSIPANATAGLGLRWTKSDGSYGGRITSTNVPVTGQWQEVLVPSAVVPYAATAFQAEVALNGFPNGSQIDILVTRAFIGDVGYLYFDGSTPGYKWNGTIGWSTSSAIAPAVQSIAIKSKYNLTMKKVSSSLFMGAKTRKAKISSYTSTTIITTQKKK
jgi:hypothetical protein